MKATTLPLFLLFAAGAALADDAAVLKCRALPDTAARLACYDAIPVGAPAAVPAVAATAAAPAVPAVPAAAAATPEQRFGLEQVKPAAKAAPEEPKSIESTIAGRFTGWGPSTLFTLTNGQVWRVVDGSSAEFPATTNQQVRIVRNFFGTMFLEVAGSNQSAKVRRVR